MRALNKIRQAVGTRRDQLVYPVYQAYRQRVVVGVSFWVAMGRPACWRPQVPWWEPFVWHGIIASGFFSHVRFCVPRAFRIRADIACFRPWPVRWLVAVLRFLLHILSLFVCPSSR